MHQSVQDGFLDTADVQEALYITRIMEAIHEELVYHNTPHIDRPSRPCRSSSASPRSTRCCSTMMPSSSAGHTGSTKYTKRLTPVRALLY
jgi:hypothetical protein